MAITKTIKIDDKDVVFKASAAIPRLYRIKFRRDVYADMSKLMASMNESSEELSIESLEIFENFAYIMAKHADPAVPDDPDEWLDQFNTFSVYMILPQLIELWGLNIEQQAESKKKLEQLTGK